MKYVHHFRLLSSAIYILSKQNISFEDIETATRELNEYVDTFEHLYGKSNVTINLHLLRHLPMCVKNLGPLWSTSAYAFEANNGVVVKGNTCTRDIIHQLTWKYVMKQSIVEKEKEAINFSINGKKTVRINPSQSQLFANENLMIPSKNCLDIYKSVTVRGVKYTSEQSRDISTIDFFVRLKDNRIAAIFFFTLFDHNLYALINVYESIDTNAHFIKIKRTQTQQVIKINDVSEKMIYLKIGLNEFVTGFPNRFEKT